MDENKFNINSNIYLANSISKEEMAFLNDINKNLPKNVNWKRGALDYISNYVMAAGSHAKWYHYSIPFGDNYQSSFRLVYNFYNILQLLDLPPKSKFIDVGCGSGWLAQFLAKLNYCSLGLDISEEMIAIAKDRVTNDIYTPFKNIPLSVDFLVHDIEEKPLPHPDLYDVAIFESALHHFYDPISAIRNISKNLKEEGYIVILEGCMPIEGSKDYNNLFDVMNKFQTLERPYAREQLKKLLNICGFNYFKFYYSINGFFEEGIDNSQLLEDLSLQQAGNNNVVASRRVDSIERLTEARCPNVINKKRKMKTLTTIAYRKLKGSLFPIKPRESNMEIISGLKKIQEVPKDPVEAFMLDGDGWHGIESWDGIPTRWIKDEAAIFIYSTQSRTTNLKLEAQSFHRPRTLEVFLGDEFVARATIASDGFTSVTAQIRLAKGKNTLLFQVLEGYEKPCNEQGLNNPDSRCLSVALRNVKL